MQETETWRQLTAYGNISLFSGYSVSSLGRLKRKETIIKGSVTAGYYRTTLKRANGRHNVKVLFHRAVCQVFNGDQPSATCTVDHINRKPSDNRAVNLRWATISQQLANRTCPVRKRNRRVLFQSSQTLLFENYVEVDSANSKHTLSQLRDAASKTRRCGWRSFGLYWRYKPLDIKEGETWVSWTSYNGAQLRGGYELSSYGRFKSRHQVFEGYLTPFGYRSAGVVLASGKHINAFLHRAVCETFNGESPSTEHTVDHIDRNPANNVAANLRWASKQEQSLNRSNALPQGGR